MPFQHKGANMKNVELEELNRLIDKSGLKRVEIANYLGIGERTIYTWLWGSSRIPKMALIALKVLVKEI
jgi:DNA-binding transcriptional regulator YiaG